MAVAGFWANSTMEPKRQFRFKVEITGINADTGGPLVWYAKAVNKPSFEVSTGEHVYLNHKFYYPGGVTWNPVSLTLVDPRDPDMSATLSDIVQQKGFAVERHVIEVHGKCAPCAEKA